MNIALVEDRDMDADVLAGFLKQYQKNQSLELRVSRFRSGTEFLASPFEKFHLVFMDIYMEGMDGIEAAGQILERDADCLVVFFTSSREDIWRAVKVHGCFDYIEKDALAYERIEEVLNAAWKRLQFQARTLTFYNGKQKVRLPLGKIQYLVSHDKYTLITLSDRQELQYRVTFSFLCSLLERETRFLLCNRGILLNIDYVRQAGREFFVMADGKTFPIRRRDHSDIIRKFNDYQFQKLNEQGV